MADLNEPRNAGQDGAALNLADMRRPDIAGTAQLNRGEPAGRAELVDPFAERFLFRGIYRETLPPYRARTPLYAGHLHESGLP